LNASSCLDVEKNSFPLTLCDEHDFLQNHVIIHKEIWKDKILNPI